MPEPTIQTAECWGGPWDGERFAVIGCKALKLPEYGGEYLLGMRPGGEHPWSGYYEWTWWQRR